MAEVYEPYIQQLNTKDIEYNFIKDDSIKAFDLEINKMKKSVSMHSQLNRLHILLINISDCGYNQC